MINDPPLVRRFLFNAIMIALSQPKNLLTNPEMFLMKRFIVSICILIFAFLSFVSAQESRRFTVEDLLKVRRVGDPQVSPEGKRVAFTIGDVNFDANKVVTQIYVVPLGGGDMKQLTTGDQSAASPRWSPDGKKIA